MLKRLKSIGPAILITAAFIGPGTVTICSIAGFQFGFTLLWALLFSIIATIILQEMCARLGLVTQQGLGESIRQQLESPALRILGILLVVSAILIGNGAYEAGNISGAALGMDAIAPIAIGDGNINFWSVIIGGIAAALLLSGKYKVVEKALIFLAITMSIVFVSTAIMVKPDYGSILQGLFVPSAPEGSSLIIIGLIGTTVVPYNLFLHASAIREKWKTVDSLPDVRFDTIASIALGGLISIAIVISSAVASLSGQTETLSNAGDLAVQLEPVLGAWSKVFMSIGLFSAGISSTITAPLAAGYATAGIIGFEAKLSNTKFRIVAGGILIIGVVFSSVGFKPIQIIKFAQIANGILLPVSAIFLLWLMNKSSVLGHYKNNLFNNITGILIILITVVLGTKSIVSVFFGL